MSILTKSAKAQKNAFLASFKSFNSAAVVILSTERESVLVPYFEKAGAPATDASKQAQKDWARAAVLPFLPACTISAVGGVTFTTNKEKAHTFEEGTTADAFRNCGSLSSELGASMGDGKGRAVYFYREKQKRVPRIKQDLGAAGKIYETDKSGARVFDLVTVREYVCKRGDVYPAAEFIAALFLALGVTQAIAAEAAEAMREKAAKAIQAAEQAAARAAATAAKAAEQAKKAKERANDKKRAAAEKAAAEGMTAEEAQKVVQVATAKQAAEQAEQAEQASKARGENVRKKANTRTKASKQVSTK
jgi:chemotaxis protein histidine kinase CheA